MGTGIGIGIDMIESENVPVTVNLENNLPIKDFTTGQNTMLMVDDENNVYKTGLKLDYTPKKINIFEEFPKEGIK